MSDRDEETTGQYAADLHRQGEVMTAAKPPKRRRRWIGRLIGFIFVGSVVGVAIIGIIKFVNDPASGTVTAASLKSSIAPTPTPDGELDGLYIDLSYPGTFNQVSQVKNNSNDLEQYTLGSSASYRRTITVQVESLPSGRIDDDSNYRLRELQPDTYTPSVQVVNNETVTLMTKDDGSEVTFFWPHAGKLLIVAVTTTQPGDHPADFVQQILPTVRWK